MKLLGKYISPSEPLIKELQTIYGINKTLAAKICGLLQLSQKASLDNISTNEKDKLERICRVHIGIKSKLDLMKPLIEKYTSCRHYKGYRYVFGLPVRGQ